MNNPNITLSQVRAALQLKTDSLLSTMRLEHEKCRMSLYHFQTELNSKVINLPELEVLKKNQIEALKLFGFFKDRITIYFSLSHSSGMCPCIPSDFIDYLTNKVDTKRREFQVGLVGHFSTKNTYDNSVGFGYNVRIKVPATLVKPLLLKWQDGVAEYLKYEEKFKKLTLFIKNLDLESQLVLLQLQHPEEHKNLIEYTENYLNERLTIS
jgi:hypothetical protein